MLQAYRPPHTHDLKAQQCDRDEELHLQLLDSFWALVSLISGREFKLLGLEGDDLAAAILLSSNRNQCLESRDVLFVYDEQSINPVSSI